MTAHVFCKDCVHVRVGERFTTCVATTTMHPVWGELPEFVIASERNAKMDCGLYKESTRSRLRRVLLGVHK